jgi:phosphatidylinositol alpha-1,6-mannosyltransferase
MKSPQKRILLVLPEVFGCEGGIQMFCRSLCLAAGRWAENNGASVSAIVMNDRSEPDARYVNGAFSRYISARKSKARVVANYLQQTVMQAPDLTVFGHVSLAPLLLLPAARRARTCVVTHGIEVWQPLRRAEQKALQRADSVLAVSEHTRSEVLRLNQLRADRVAVFPCSLDPFWLVDECTESRNGTPVILTVCRLNKCDAYKGVDSVIRSLPLVMKECGPVAYRVVGQGDDVPRLKALAAELGVAGCVTFAGELSDEKLREAYRECSVFVMPSEREGFGIVFLEAMASGKPVIGGAHGGTPSVIKHGETGVLVDNLDIEGLARWISRVLKEDELRVGLGRAGHQRLLDQFTFRSFEANWDSFLRATLGQ